MAFKHVVKLIIVGDQAVGKSSLMTRFVDKLPISTTYTSTLGVDFRVINDDKMSTKTQIWDTAGADRYRSITASYYRTANGAILAFDLSRPETFNHLNDWIDDIRRYGNDKVKIILVGCKNDLTQAIDQRKIDAFADKYDLEYYTCSAKDDVSVDEIFNGLTNVLIKDKNTGTCALTESALNDDSISISKYPWWCSMI